MSDTKALIQIQTELVRQYTEALSFPELPNDDHQRCYVRGRRDQALDALTAFLVATGQHPNLASARKELQTKYEEGN